jgi:hypothetical protein
MRHLFAWTAIVGLATALTFGAAARRTADWPKPAAVEKAVESVKYQTEHKVVAKYKGHPVTFVPCDISDIPEATRQRGMILGKLVSEGPSADKLPAGTYLVYVQRRNDQWQAFFCDKYEPVAMSTEVKADMGNEHKPSFAVDNTTIRYWHMRIAW